jgi:hypothetical protein
MTAFTSALATVNRLAGDPFSLFVICSPEGGGVPGLSLQAIAFHFVLNEKTWSMDGTSYSTPVQFLPLGVLFSLHSPSSSTLLTTNLQTAAGYHLPVE